MSLPNNNNDDNGFLDSNNLRETRSSDTIPNIVFDGFSTEFSPSGMSTPTGLQDHKPLTAQSNFNLDYLKAILTNEDGQSPLKDSPAIEAQFALDTNGGDGNGKDNRFLLYSPLTGSVAVNKFSEFNDRNIDVIGAINSDLFWLDIVQPTPQEMVALSKIFKIHPLTVEDIMTEDVREKCELFKHYYFVTFRTFQENNEFQLTGNLIQALNVYSLVFKTGIVTFHSNYHSLTKSTLRKIDQLKSIVTLSPDWINYSILDEITDNFAPLLRQIELEVDTVDDLVLILKANEQSDMLRRIGYARKKVTTLLRLLTSKPDVIKALSSRCEERIGRTRSSGGTDIKLYLGDIQDHLITMVQNLLHYEKVLARAHSNYLAQISIELTQVSNKTNDAVAKLTIIASVLLPMNVITGMWGMNVQVPGQAQEGDSLAWFFGITASMVLIASLFFLYVKKYMLK